MLSFPDINNKIPLDFDAWKLIGDHHIELILISLKPGEAIEKHLNNIPVVFFCASGEGTLMAGGLSHPIRQNGAVYIRPDISRSVKNSGSKELRIVVFKLLQT